MLSIILWYFCTVDYLFTNVDCISFVLIWIPFWSILVSENYKIWKYPYPPPPHGRDLPYDPPSPLDFPKLAPKIYLQPPLQNFQNFHTPPGNFAISDWSEQRTEVVLFTRMPNFVSFMYFLLNSAFYYY